MKRRDFLLGGTAALATTAALAQSITPQIGGGIGQGFDGGLAGAGNSGGNLPAPPSGFQYLKGADGSYLKGADGKYLLGAVGA